MRTEFVSEAAEELREAARYYEQEAPGLGLAFIADAHRAIAEVAAHPESSVYVRQGVRKKLLTRFPYSIMYSIETEIILTIAVAHHKRRPNYWTKRMVK